MKSELLILLLLAFPSLFALSLEKNQIIRKVNHHLTCISPFKEWISNEMAERISHSLYGVTTVPYGSGTTEAFLAIERLNKDFNLVFHQAKNCTVPKYVEIFVHEFSNWLKVERAGKPLDLPPLDEQNLKRALVESAFMSLLGQVYKNYLLRWPAQLELLQEPDLEKLFKGPIPVKISALEEKADLLCFHYSDEGNLEWKGWYWALLFLLFISIVVLVMILVMILGQSPASQEPQVDDRNRNYL